MAPIMPDFLVKHTGSSAHDARVSYEIDWQDKVVHVAMTAPAGKPYFSSSHLLDFVHRCLTRDAGIKVVVDDASGWNARRPDWTVRVAVGDVEYEALFNKLILGSEICVELWPLVTP